MAIKQYLDQEGVQLLWGRICAQDQDLLNKITINSNRIDELSQQIGKQMVRYNTCEGWNSQRLLVSEEGVIYIYTDRIVQQQITPGFKIGDGAAYLIDMPFVDQQYILHILDQQIHITQEEREKWNDKINVKISSGENLLFYK